MDSVSIGELEAHLGELIERVEAGETIEITRGGKPIAQLARSPKTLRRIDGDALRALTAGMTPQTESAGEFMRRLRDDERY